MGALKIPQIVVECRICRLEISTLEIQGDHYGKGTPQGNTWGRVRLW